MKKIVVTLKMTYLVEMNKNKLVSEGNSKKKLYTQKLENIRLFDIRKYNKRQDYVGECKLKVRKVVKTTVEILYVVYVRMSG